MLTRRSKNSYIRSPRSVTMAPIGMPSRTLKAAIDLRARVTTGFCPVICPSSLTAGSRIFAFCVASPTPMLTTILFSRGTAAGFLRSSSFISVGASSFSNLVRSRGRSFAEWRGASGPAFGTSDCAPLPGFPFFCCCSSFAIIFAFSHGFGLSASPCQWQARHFRFVSTFKIFYAARIQKQQLLIEGGPALLADAHFPVAANFMSYAHRAACGTHQRDIGQRNPPLLLGDAALDVPLRIRPHVLFYGHNVLDQNLEVVRKHAQHAPFLARITARHDLDGIVPSDVHPL